MAKTKTLRVRRPLSAVERVEIEASIRSCVARYKQIEERKKAFAKLCAAEMKSARAQIEANVEAIDRGYKDEDVQAMREGDAWTDQHTGEVINPATIVPDGDTDDKQLDLFEDEEIAFALATREAVVESGDDESDLVIRLKRPRRGLRDVIGALERAVGPATIEKREAN